MRELIAMDFHLFEFFINTFSEMEPEFLREIKRMADDSGSVIKSIHPFTSGFEGFLLFSDYDRRSHDGLEFYKQYFHAANVLGAEIMVLHGQRDYTHSRALEEKYFEHYAQLYRLGKRFGVTVAQENVNLFRSEDPAFILRMKEFLREECAFVLDVKQAVRAGKDPYEMCAAMGERLVHVHINDNQPGTDCLLPGRGTMDFSALFQQMWRFDYQGDLMIEVYRHDFGNLEELLSAKKNIERLPFCNT